MRWDYPPLDINPVFSGLGELLLLLLLLLLLYLHGQLLCTQLNKSWKEKGVQLELSAMDITMTRQYFTQDWGQDHYKAMSGQSFKYDHGQGQPQDPKTNSIATFSGFHFASQLCIPAQVLAV